MAVIYKLAFGSKADVRVMSALPQQWTLTVSNWVAAIGHYLAARPEYVRFNPLTDIQR